MKLEWKNHALHDAIVSRIVADEFETHIGENEGAAEARLFVVLAETYGLTNHPKLQMLEYLASSDEDDHIIVANEYWRLSHLLL